MAVPTDYAGLELWLKGDAGVFQDDAATTPATTTGDVVAVWQDQSGNARHATQTTNARRPTFLAPGLNGINALRFNGTSQHYLSLPNFLTGFTFGEVFVVIKLETDLSAAAARAGLWAFGSFNDGDYYAYTDGNSYAGFGSSARKIFPQVGAPDLTQWKPWHFISKSAAWEHSIDGVQQHGPVANTVAWRTTPVIGRTGDAASYLDGRIVELFIYSAERSGAERQALMDYLTTRYFAPKLRDSQVYLEVAHDPGGQKLRDSQLFLEVAHDIDNKLRQSQLFLEVAYIPAPPSTLGTRIMGMIGS